jgi:hypothetical protein
LAWFFSWWPPGSQNILSFLLVLVGAGQLYILAKSIPLARKAADAAKKSADTQKEAMLKIERPHLLFENLKMVGFYLEPLKDSEVKPSLEEIRRRMEAPRYPTVSYQLKNYGKSPAWIMRWSIQFNAATQLPLQPHYDEKRIIGYAVPARGTGQGECPFRPIGMTYEQWMAILIPNSFLFVYGFIEYSDIFKEAPHKSGFCYKWIAPTTIFPEGYWEPVGPESYWYYT